MCAEIVITRKLQISRNLISYQAQLATVGRQESRHSRLRWVLFGAWVARRSAR